MAYIINMGRDFPPRPILGDVFVNLDAEVFMWTGEAWIRTIESVQEAPRKASCTGCGAPLSLRAMACGYCRLPTV